MNIKFYVKLFSGLFKLAFQLYNKKFTEQLRLQVKERSS